MLPLPKSGKNTIVSTFVEKCEIHVENNAAEIVLQM